MIAKQTHLSAPSTPRPSSQTVAFDTASFRVLEEPLNHHPFNARVIVMAIGEPGSQALDRIEACKRQAREQERDIGVIVVKELNADTRPLIQDALDAARRDRHPGNRLHVQVLRCDETVSIGLKQLPLGDCHVLDLNSGHRIDPTVWSQPVPTSPLPDPQVVLQLMADRTDPTAQQRRVSLNDPD